MSCYVRTLDSLRKKGTNVVWASYFIKYFWQCKLSIGHRRDPSIGDDCHLENDCEAVVKLGSCFSIRDMSVARIRRVWLTSCLGYPFDFMLLGQCKARPLNFHQVSFFVSLFLGFFVSVPQHAMVAKTCVIVMMTVKVILCIHHHHFCTGQHLHANVYRIFNILL